MQNTMEYGKAFTFPQEDPEWIKKVAIAGVVMLLSFIPVLNIVTGLLMSGYTLEITRRVIVGERTVLPEWTDFGALLKKGLFAFVVGLVYAIPLILLASCIALPQIGVALTANGDSDTANTVSTISSIVGACFGCLCAIYGILFAMVVPAAIVKLAVTGAIGPALRVGEVFALVRAKPGVYIVVALLAGLAISVLSSIGSIACVIGAAWGIAYGLIAAAHLYGQAYRVASGEGGAASAPATM